MRIFTPKIAFVIGLFSIAFSCYIAWNTDNPATLLIMGICIGLNSVMVLLNGGYIAYSQELEKIFESHKQDFLKYLQDNEDAHTEEIKKRFKP